MQAVEFEADIQDGVVRVPEQYAQLKNAHARVVILFEESPEASPVDDRMTGLDFSRFDISSLGNREGVEYQREVRDEW